MVEDTFTIVLEHRRGSTWNTGDAKELQRGDNGAIEVLYIHPTEDRYTTEEFGLDWNVVSVTP